MKRREIWMSAWILVAIAPPFFGVGLNRWIALQRERMRPGYAVEIYLRRRFLSIKPRGGKVLMVPGPSIKGLAFNNDFYTLSLANDGYWKKPMVVGKGFKFGYFDGAKDYDYEILDIQQQGVIMRYSGSALPPEILNVVWK